MASKKAERTYLSPPIHYDSTKKGPLHSAHSTKPYYEPKPKPLKRDLKPYGTPTDDRTEIANIAKGIDELARLYDKGKPVLQAPRYMRNKTALRKRLDKEPSRVMGDLERYLHVDMSQVRRLPTTEKRSYLIKHLERYLSNKIPETIAEEKRHPDITTPQGQNLYTLKRKDPQGKGRGYYYHPGHGYQLAAAVIGITILLLLGTSFFTGQVTGSFVTELENSSQFPYTLLLFLVVVFLFGMIWQHSKRPLVFK